ncbi:Rad52/Rad22 family DNA repair protein [Symbiopectobacterium purcellii]|uniref:Rad52/Rad22 family DNA repair protein n=1 Tax=Symbiopectobacterium purcellii TaxID=2871826 RepID=UPI003F84C183
MDLSQLDAPFPVDDIEWRVQRCGIAKNNPWAMVLAYVTNRAIMKRLDDVCGKENWKNEFTPGPDGGVMCGIYIRIRDEWVAKWDGADKTQVEAVKGGMSGSMKRAAVQWGIGRYLYSLEENFAICSIEKKNGWNKASFKDTDNQYKNIWWQTPPLPEWAMPTPPDAAQGESDDANADESNKDELLKSFTESATSAKNVDQLKAAFEEAWRALRGTPQQADAKGVYDIRKSELEEAA